MISDIDDTKAPLVDHLIELRRRLLWCVAALMTGFFICLYFAKPIFAILVQPLLAAGQGKLIYTDIFEAFFVEFILGAALAPARGIDGGVQRDAMDPGIEGRITAEFLAAVPGLKQRLLHRVRGQIGVARDAQAGVVPAAAAFPQDGLERVGPDPGFEEREHGTRTGYREKG